MTDPYYEWLGISPSEHPVSHYRLLGIREFETDATVISNAADRQMNFVKQFAGGPNSAASQQILNRLAEGRICLLNPAKKVPYDAALSRHLLSLT